MISILLSPDDRELIAGLTQQNAKVITWSTPQIHGREDHSALDEAIENLFGYDWLIFKNEHAAKFFLKRMRELNHHADELDSLKVLAIGDGAEQTLVDVSIHIDIALS